MHGQRNNNRAFTLAEMTLTLGMMGILMSVVAVPASDMLRNARQKELDNMARTLYMSAQMGLTAAKLAGKEIDVSALSPTAGAARGKLRFIENGDGALKTALSDEPSSDVQLWKTDETAQALQDFLFPRISERGVRSVSAELFDGYWAVTFDPYAYSVVSAYFTKNDGGDGAAYFQDLYSDANREGRLSELTRVENRLKDGALIGYYGSEGVGFAADMPFERIANGGPNPKNPSGGSPSPLSFREGAVTQKTPANSPENADNLSHKMYCWIGYEDDASAPIFNGETLVTRLNCWIPADSAFEIDRRPADVELTFTVTGADSGKSATFRYRLERYGEKTLCRDMDAAAPAFALEGICRREAREAVPGWLYSYPVVLDSLSDSGEGAFLHGNRPFKARFPDFIPGEDIVLQFEADIDENVKKEAKRAALRALSDGEKAAYGLERISEGAVIDDTSGAYDWLWKSHWPGWDERPVSNSLFAKSLVDNNGVYTAEIACGRHLQNLDAEISGFGAAETDAASVRALQTADIALNAAFTPVSNDKLMEYDGGGWRIDNLQIRLTEQDAKGAGLFGVLSGDVTLKNLTLTNPVVLADTESGVGALAGKASADSNVKFSCVTVIDPVIRAGNASGVGGLIGEADAGSYITLSSVQLYMSEKSYADKKLDNALSQWLAGGERVGGLIGCAAGNVTITGADGVPTFAAAVVNASAYAGGLAGYVAGKLDIDNAWADCYLKSGACIGGLAGYCGPDSAFRRCYAAGFVVGDTETPRSVTAAGFAPCDVASVADAYSILNFGDLSLTGYGLFRDALSVSDAYFAYGGEASAGVGEEIDGESLKTALSAENGFRTGGTPTAPYDLTDAQSGAFYPYPALGERHYNDYLVSERPAPQEPEKVEIIVDFAFGDAMGYVEAYRDLGFWDAPDALRQALDAAQFASAWGEAGRAALKISAAAGTTLRQNLNGLTFEGFALDEDNSTLDELIRQNPEDAFSLSYLRIFEDPQNAETWSDELWTE